MAHVAAGGCENPICHRGDRSAKVCRVHPYLALFCNIAHGVLLQSECQGLHYTGDEGPWRSMFRRFRITRIMASNSFAKVLVVFGSASRSNKTFCNHIIGARGFEPPTSWSQTTRSTKLSYAPNRA